VSVLHFIPGDLTTFMETLRKQVAPGSLLVISHATVPPGDACAAKADAVVKLYARTPTPLHLRPRDEITQLLAGLDLVPPGLVPVNTWSTNDDRDASTRVVTGLLAAVARKPARTTHTDG
jgi:hypothetical protein